MENNKDLYTPTDEQRINDLFSDREMLRHQLEVDTAINYQEPIDNIEKRNKPVKKVIKGGFL